jgi:hypothetical protein
MPMDEVEVQPDGPRKGRPPSGRPRLALTLTIRSTPEWKAWLDARCREEGTTPADLFERLLIEEERRKKRPRPPNRTQ